MLLPSTSIHETEENEADVPLLSALLQLKQFQQASTCHCPLPLVILVPGSDTGVTQKLEEGDSESTSQIILLHTLNPFFMNVGTILNTPWGYVFVFLAFSSGSSRAGSGRFDIRVQVFLHTRVFV